MLEILFQCSLLDVKVFGQQNVSVAKIPITSTEDQNKSPLLHTIYDQA
jgi:hypothetical protein